MSRFQDALVAKLKISNEKNESKTSGPASRKDRALSPSSLTSELMNPRSIAMSPTGTSDPLTSTFMLSQGGTTKEAPLNKTIDGPERSSKVKMDADKMRTSMRQAMIKTITEQTRRQSVTRKGAINKTPTSKGAMRPKQPEMSPEPQIFERVTKRGLEISNSKLIEVQHDAITRQQRMQRDTTRELNLNLFDQTPQTGTVKQEVVVNAFDDV